MKPRLLTCPVLLAAGGVGAQPGGVGWRWRDADTYAGSITECEPHQ